MPTRRVLLQLNELRTDTSIRDKRAAVAIQLSQVEVDALTTGLEPQPLLAPFGPGLQVIPIPGESGYIAFPRCMPDEVPLIDKDGNLRCVGTGCAWGIDAKGRFACTGTCAGGIPCVRRLQLVEVGFFLSCLCPHRPPTVV